MAKFLFKITNLIEKETIFFPTHIAIKYVFYAYTCKSRCYIFENWKKKEKKKKFWAGFI